MTLREACLQALLADLTRSDLSSLPGHLFSELISRHGPVADAPALLRLIHSINPNLTSLSFTSMTVDSQVIMLLNRFERLERLHLEQCRIHSLQLKRGLLALEVIECQVERVCLLQLREVMTSLRSLTLLGDQLPRQFRLPLSCIPLPLRQVRLSERVHQDTLLALEQRGIKPS